MRNAMSYRVTYKNRAFVPLFDVNDHLIYWLRTIPTSAREAERQHLVCCFRTLTIRRSESVWERSDSKFGRVMAGEVNGHPAPKVRARLVACRCVHHLHRTRAEGGAHTTRMLMNREMRARSLRRAAASCN